MSWILSKPTLLQEVSYPGFMGFDHRDLAQGRHRPHADVIVSVPANIHICTGSPHSRWHVRDGRHRVHSGGAVEVPDKLLQSCTGGDGRHPWLLATSSTVGLKTRLQTWLPVSNAAVHLLLTVFQSLCLACSYVTQVQKSR